MTQDIVSMVEALTHANFRVISKIPLNQRISFSISILNLLHESL